MAKINDLLKIVLDSGSSDLHLVVGSPPTLRTHGKLSFIENEIALDSAVAAQLVMETMKPAPKEFFFKLSPGQTAALSSSQH